jgi:hypothetical protein
VRTKEVEIGTSIGQKVPILRNGAETSGDIWAILSLH